MWLVACIGALHFLALPCAMAGAGDAPACGHCAGMTDPEPCLSAGGSMSLGQTAPAAREPWCPHPPGRHCWLAPVPGSTDLVNPGPGRGVALHTGRHSGDPPLRLRFGHLRI